MSEHTTETDDTRQWSVEAENGQRCHTSQDVAEAVAAGDSGYTLGSERSPLLRAYVRPNRDAAWEPLSSPPGATEDGAA